MTRYGLGVAGSTVGFVGFGAVGQATASRLEAFEVCVCVCVCVCGGGADH